MSAGGGDGATTSDRVRQSSRRGLVGRRRASSTAAAAAAASDAPTTTYKLRQNRHPARPIARMQDIYPPPTDIAPSKIATTDICLLRT